MVQSGICTHTGLGVKPVFMARRKTSSWAPPLLVDPAALLHYSGVSTMWIPGGIPDIGQVVQTAPFGCHSGWHHLSTSDGLNGDRRATCKTLASNQPPISPWSIELSFSSARQDPTGLPDP